MSCLFRALGNAVGLNENTMRMEIVDFLKTNPPLMGEDATAVDIVNWTDSCSLGEYTKHMSKNSTWGGAMEIRAFCQMYRAQVAVHYNNRKILFEPHCKPIRNYHLEYTGNHFELIR